MARKRRTTPAAGDRPTRLADDRFAALKQARARPRSGTDKTPSPPRTSAPETPPAIDDDAALFRQQVGDATPLPASNRALVEPARPAPVPRPKPTDDVETGAARHDKPPPADDAAYFRHLMQDVTPLPERNLAYDESVKPEPPPIPPAAEMLNPDDVLGWLAASTTPLKDNNRVDIEPPPPVAAPRQKDADARAVLSESLDPFTLEDRLDIGEEATFLRPGLPRRVLTDLRRGRWIVQNEIDLHGMTRDEARIALGEFLAVALLRGQRCVRVVHGKGLRSPGKVGVLKHLSRGWLAQREEILAFCQARPHEGGSGALRVLLRAADKRPRA